MRQGDGDRGNRAKQDRRTIRVKKAAKVREMRAGGREEFANRLSPTEASIRQS